MKGGRLSPRPQSSFLLRPSSLPHSPLTPTLSPEYRGEGEWGGAARSPTALRRGLPSSAPTGLMLDLMPTSPLKLAVLVSGSGTTLQNLIDLIAAGQLDARVEVVVASRPGIKGIDRAAAADVP